MKLYGGIDLHSNNSVFSIKDEAGVAIARRKLFNDLTQIFLFLEPYKKQLTGLVVESTFNWYWLVDAQTKLTTMCILLIPRLFNNTLA
ncbi:MAG: hypothetical protein V7782_11955 [Psychromonas sp.]